MINNLPTRDTIIAWVNALPDGYNWESKLPLGVCTSCLVADYLRQHGHPHAFVGVETVYLDNTATDQEALPLTTDLIRLVAKFDLLNDLYNHRVTRELVLRHL